VGRFLVSTINVQTQGKKHKRFQRSLELSEAVQADCSTALAQR